MPKYGYAEIADVDRVIDMLVRVGSRETASCPLKLEREMYAAVVRVLQGCRSEIACAHSDESAKMGAVEYLTIQESNLMAQYQAQIDALNEHRRQLREGLLRMAEQLK
jgi:hypothetical protein